MPFDKLKLTHQLAKEVENAGFTDALPLQDKVVPRINGGQEVICIAPEGSGKSTALVISILNRLKLPFEEVPRALVLVPDRERVTKMVDLFNEFAGKSGLRIIGVSAGGGMEGQKDLISDGCDILIGTPDRVLALYIKSGININKIQQFVLDDAELIVKQGLQSQVHQITLSLPKCQHILFSEVYHEKLERLASFMANPVVIEIEPEAEKILQTVPLFMYKVPNYKTKQNLLNLLVSDGETYTKVLLFVKTKLTALNLYKSLSRRFSGEIALLKPPVYEQQGFKNVEEFKKSPDHRVLVISNDIEQFINFNGISHIIHFDLAADTDPVISRISSENFKGEPAVSLMFSTDLELPLIKKIELQTGNKMEVLPFPPGLVIEGSRRKKQIPESTLLPEKSADPNKGAFHEKKASNAKDYNWGWKEKNKLFGKKYKKSNKK